MKIDTLVLSGGGPSGIAYFGFASFLLSYEFTKKNQEDGKILFESDCIENS